MISVRWSYLEWPGIPAELPEWVGYDVLRRPVDECGEYVRVNAEPFPRIVGKSHEHTYTEPAPAMGTTYQYQVILVDANRQRLTFNPAVCECGAANSGWASCPDYSAPLTQGTLEDWGWALYVHPSCPNSCYWGFYFQTDTELTQELRAYAGTGTVVRLYGDAFCGGTEGCGMRVDHYDVGTCNVITAALRKTWGQVKRSYR